MSVVTLYQNELLERDLDPTDSGWGFFNCGDVVYMSTRALRSVRGLRGLGAAACKTDAQVLAETHQMLAFTMYVRQAAGKVLSKPGRTLQPVMVGREAKLVIDPPIMPEETPPWSPLSNPLRQISILANVSKMKCPSFSLPAGSHRFGGSCNGSRLGMTIEPEMVLRSGGPGRRHIARLTGLNESISTDKWYSTAVCQYCYAIKGNYSYFSKQVAQVALMRWTEAAVKDGSFVPVMIQAIEASPFHIDDERDRRYLKPYGYKRVFRLHDAGDFFSKEYVAAWKQIADHFRPAQYGGTGTPTLFWAPSRLWAAGDGGGRAWLEAFGAGGDLRRSNMVIRPSAYHTNAHAPLPAGGEVAGSVVHTTEEDSAEERAMYIPGTQVGHREDGSITGLFPQPQGKGLFHYVCPASRKNAKDNNCLDVIGPDGKEGCRACWMLPDAIISYHIH